MRRQKSERVSSLLKRQFFLTLMQQFNVIALPLVPFTSVLVRYRASYDPKSTTDTPVASSSTVEEHAVRIQSPTSLFGTAKKIYQILVRRPCTTHEMLLTHKQGIKGFTYGMGTPCARS
jgi:hypothetical protein